jgi:hypothetical protein
MLQFDVVFKTGRYTREWDSISVETGGAQKFGAIAFLRAPWWTINQRG